MDRKLWILKTSYIIGLVNEQDHALSLRHIKTNTMKNIGYARKSRTNERHEKRADSLNSMIHRLYEVDRCSSIYVSPYTNADDIMERRDVHEDMQVYREQLLKCNGSTQDLIQKLNVYFSDVRLVVIDYAGLSTNPADIRCFVEKYTQIKEIVIDHGMVYEIFTRHDLLTDPKVILSFDCRVAPRRRSTMS